MRGGKHKIIDLFCGTGGFSYGFEQLPHGNFETIMGVDVLSEAVATFKLNHPLAAAIHSDIRRFSPADAADVLGMGRGDADVILGGPPCQGFSSIRPHRSTNHFDQRNSLFKDFAEFVDFFRPRVFVMENVVGLATHNGGRDIELIENRFRSLGYSVDWWLLNAANFGVPQKRERLIMVGAENCTELEPPTPTHFFKGKVIGYHDKRKMVRTAARNSVFQEKPLFKALSVMRAISDLPHIASGEEATRYDDSKVMNEYQVARRNGAKMLTLHKATEHTPRMIEIIKHSGSSIRDIPKDLISSGFSTSYSRLDPNDPSVTLTVNFVHPASNKCIHPHQDRALTPREGARIQSFDDTFGFAGTRTQMVKMIGNAVPPLLGRAIAGKVVDLLH